MIKWRREVLRVDSQFLDNQVMYDYENDEKQQ